MAWGSSRNRYPYSGEQECPLTPAFELVSFRSKRVKAEGLGLFTCSYLILVGPRHDAALGI